MDILDIQNSTSLADTTAPLTYGLAFTTAFIAYSAAMILGL